MLKIKRYISGKSIPPFATILLITNRFLSDFKRIPDQDVVVLLLFNLKALQNTAAKFPLSTQFYSRTISLNQTAKEIHQGEIKWLCLTVEAFSAMCHNGRWSGLDNACQAHCYISHSVSELNALILYSIFFVTFLSFLG